MRTVKRRLLLVLALIILLSSFCVGVSAYTPIRKTNVDASVMSITLGMYTDDTLAQLPVRSFLEQLSTQTHVDETALQNATKIAWSRDGSDNYKVADVSSGTMDLRFNTDNYLHIYMVVGSGKMLDFDGNKCYSIYVYQTILSEFNLFYQEDGEDWKSCENQSYSAWSYLGSYTSYSQPEDSYHVGFLQRDHIISENAKYQLRFKLLVEADEVAVYEGMYASVAEAEASGKRMDSVFTGKDGLLSVNLDGKKLCLVMTTGSNRRLHNIRISTTLSNQTGDFSIDGLYKGEHKLSSSWSSKGQGNTTEYTYYLASSADDVNAAYALKMEYTAQRTGNSSPQDVVSAYVDGGTENIKDALFGNGYSANYSGSGHTFALTDRYGYSETITVKLCPKQDESTIMADSNGDVYFQAKTVKDEAGNSVYAFVMPSDADSLYRSSDNCYQTVLLRPNAILDASMLKPVFYVQDNTEVYAKSVGETGAVKQTSGVSVVDFTNNPVQYTAKDGQNSTIKNYWVSYAQSQQSPTLFVNGPGFDSVQSGEVEEENKREILLSDTSDYHDIFFANLGGSELSALSVSLDEEAQKTLKLDDFFTMGDSGNDTVGAFAASSYNCQYAAKIRLRMKDEADKLETDKISGVLTITSAAGSRYIYLTGTISPKIVDTPVPNGVKYVPYSVMIQTTNHSDATKVSFKLSNGTLPTGLKLNENTGELYGVPTQTGKYNFTVTASFSTDGLKASSKEYAIEIKDNTDENVEAKNDHEILNRVQNIDNQEQFYDQEFHIDHEYNEFVKFFIDGVCLTEGDDYLSEEGSTKITIRAKTFASFGNGKHTIAAEFRTNDNIMTKSTQNYVANAAQSKPTVRPRPVTTKPSASKQESTQQTGTFTDVHEQDWFYENVMWAYREGYMVGVSSNRFAPKQDTTQAMVITVLARIAKADLTKYERADQKQWYSAAANWASDIGMIDLSTFAPNDSIRRGDLAVMLMKLFEQMDVDCPMPEDGQKLQFADSEEMVEAEEQAFQKLAFSKIFRGNGNNDMQPNGFTTRAQLAALIQRISGFISEKKK